MRVFRKNGNGQASGVFSILIIVLSLMSCSPQQTEVLVERSRIEFPNILNIEGSPEHLNDFDAFFFADQGAWFGFALPESKESKDAGIGFKGPFLLSHGSWLATSFADLKIYQSENGEDFISTVPMSLKSTYFPGILRIESENEQFSIHQELCYSEASTALIKVKIKNLTEADIYVQNEWLGSLWMEGVQLSVDGSRVIATIQSSSDVYAINFDVNAGYAPEQTEQNKYKMKSKPYLIEAGAIYEEIVTLRYSPVEAQPAAISLQEANQVFTENEERWNNYINAILSEESDLLKDPEYQAVAVKSLQTLILNWRGPRGALRHGGLFPSAAVWYFNGFWGWDSWKHVVALARFAPEIAEEQILTMFDYQDEYGMIADCIYADSSENNWRNTKPPLAAWAISELYDRSANLDFVKAIYPKLVKYHEWWYEHRDHDQDGFCEYGCTDGTIVAAKWESGVDDGIHYDSSTVLQNNEYAWSLDQESVDLNSYLFLEKIYLAKLSRLLGDENTAKQYSMDAAKLKVRIQEDMFDEESNFFYDIGIENGEFIGVYGPQGWIPLWTGVATAEQAAAVRTTIMDPEHFATYIPFPTVSKSNHAYLTGYWRGPVWLDQAFFGISGLRKYGYEEDAIQFTKQLIDNAEGLKGAQGPIRENYNPETGEGMKVNHFSWSAAHLLMMLWEM